MDMDMDNGRWADTQFSEEEKKFNLPHSFGGITCECLWSYFIWMHDLIVSSNRMNEEQRKSGLHCVFLNGRLINDKIKKIQFELQFKWDVRRWTSRAWIHRASCKYCDEKSTRLLLPRRVCSSAGEDGTYIKTTVECRACLVHCSSCCHSLCIGACEYSKLRCEHGAIPSPKNLLFFNLLWIFVRSTIAQQQLEPQHSFMKTKIINTNRIEIKKCERRYTLHWTILSSFFRMRTEGVGHF